MIGVRMQCQCEPLYSDVERALQTWLRQNDVLAKYETRLAEETEVAERVVLARLQAKYALRPA